MLHIHRTVSQFALCHIICTADAQWPGWSECAEMSKCDSAAGRISEENIWWSFAPVSSVRQEIRSQCFSQGVFSFQPPSCCLNSILIPRMKHCCSPTQPYTHPSSVPPLAPSYQRDSHRSRLQLLRQGSAVLRWGIEGGIERG